VSEICTSVQEHRWIGKSNAEACQRINSGIEAFFTFFFLDKKEPKNQDVAKLQPRKPGCWPGATTALRAAANEETSKLCRSLIGNAG
jgi:hypothetical protein